MNRIITRGIILSRTDYGEADRILTMLTPDHGKLRCMARGVRKAKSKLAGSIELFSTADITFIEGRGEIATLISARLIKHYGRIVHDIDRVQLGYELIKILDRATEEHPEPDYYRLLEQSFAALDDSAIDPGLIRIWFEARLLSLGGHPPNLRTDSSGHKLPPDKNYGFDLESMTLTPQDSGKFTAGHVKVLRLLFDDHKPQELAKVNGLDKLIPELAPLVNGMLKSFVRT